MSRPRTVRSVIGVAALLSFGTLAGCGQRGPLTLPDSAKPIERLDPSKTRRAAPAGAANPQSDTEQPPQPAPGQDGSDRADEDRTRNER